jgi:hypothetical protein
MAKIYDFKTRKVLADLPTIFDTQAEIAARIGYHIDNGAYLNHCICCEDYKCPKCTGEDDKVS